ncbi:MAG: xanthine dehydrogenase small subunit [Leptospirales bacterium]|nr:xanthine dehydrogenase small subunit [Leptospirales bacterium]
MNRSEIVFYLNGQRQVVSGPDVFLPLSSYLRYSLHLTGTKVVCSEGDCGACTVVLGWLDAENKLSYRMVDSCIQFVYQLDLCHVISIEGIGTENNLHPAQKAMVEHFGSQCGFCTPGFVMALVDLTEKQSTYNSVDVREKLTGNLCRCTGYEAIVKAALSLSDTKVQSIIQSYNQEQMTSEFRALRGDNVLIEADTGFAQKKFFKPSSLAEALNHKSQHPKVRLVAGATDVGVQANKRRSHDTEIMFIAHLHEMGSITVPKNPTEPQSAASGSQIPRIEIGAVANWTDIREAVRPLIPAFAEILDIFAAEQIRNAATIGGNIANGSPIGDSLPVLYALDATLTVQSAAGSRQVLMNNFFRGYKQMDLKQDEILTNVSIPVPRPGSILKLYKVSRRKDLDISTATLAIYLEMEDGKVSSSRIAAGGVGPTIQRLSKAEGILSGEKLTESLLRQAGKAAVGEIAPLTDVRGSREYRLQLIENLFHKFYFEEIRAREVA